MLIFVSALVHHLVQADTDEQANPPMELLEFLGQWTDEHGDEIDFELLEEAQSTDIRETRYLDRLDRSAEDQF